MEQLKLIQADQVSWEPHPQFENVEVASLLSNRDDRMDLSIMLVRLPPGTVVEKHVHDCDDIAYVIRGRGSIWIEGVGDRPMTEGSFVRIPKGVQHFVHDVEEELFIYDMFYPFLV